MAPTTSSRSRGGPRTPGELRALTGLSVNQVAKRARISPATLTKVENGGEGATLSTLTKVAQVYGVTVLQLLAGCERARRP